MSTSLRVSLSLVSRLLSSTAASALYSANGFNPAVVADFINQRYQGEGAKTLTTLIKHNSSTAGNATMTGGYGPELITNGDFSDGTTGWTTNGDVRVLSGQILVRNNTAAISDIRQTISVTSGKLYEISFNFVDSNQANIRVSIDDASYQFTGDVLVENISSTGRHSFTFVATSSNAYIRLMTNSTTNGHSTTWDNISVREVPKIQWRPHNLLAYSEDVTANKYIDFGSTGNVTFVDPTTITFAAGTANASNKTLETTNLVGQQITGAIELSSQTHAGEKVQLRLNWRNGDAVYSDVHTLTTTPTFVYVTGTVPAGTTGVDLIVYQPVGEQVEKTFTATKWHVYRSDLGGMADVPMSERVHPSANTYVRTAGREVTGIELVENGTFDTDYTNWTNYNGGTISVSNGELNISTDPTIQNTGVYQQFDTIVGRVYQVSGDVTSVDSTPRLLIGNGIGSGLYVNLSHNNHGETKTLSGTFVAVATTTYISLQTAPVNSQSKYDNISIKEIDVDPSTARYLPRIGHHVYNGSAWVNEGLLHESGTRTNLLPYSNGFDNSAWYGFGTAPTVTADAAVSPSSNNDAYKINGAGTGSGLVELVSGSASTDYTASLFIKQNTSTKFRLFIRDGDVGSDVVYVTATLASGVVTVDNGTENGNFTLVGTSVQDYGNDWYRIAITATTSSSTSNVKFEFGVNDPSGTGDLFVYGAQLEEGSVASSYIPTLGTTTTRAAETLDIEHENLPWPEPVVIGDELVTNGTFDTDVSGWTDASSAGGSISWNASGYLELDAATATSRANQDVSVTTGSVYAISTTVIDLDGSSACGLYLDGAGSSSVNFVTEGVGTHTIYYVAPGNTLNLSFRNFTTGTTVLLDNISVKEINPLSVSIAMEGRMTYTDNDQNSEFSFYDWFIGANDYLRTYFQTSDGTGKIVASQNDGGTFDGKTTGGSAFSPDALVPYSFAVRHGSNFINMSSDGGSFNANTTPLNLPDASSTDIRIAKSAGSNNYIGTIRSFRIWANDIGDDGIIEASEPELQPTLSLSFDGTESSFIDFEWSE